MREKINNLFKSIKNMKKINIFYISAIILFLAFIIPNSFSAQVPVKSIIIKSQEVNYDNKEAGSWQATKSAEWTGLGKARITFDLDTVVKTENKNTDVILVLDISGSMNGDKLDRVKKDTTELLNSLLSNSNNRAALISFASNSTIKSNLTNNKDELISSINSLTANGMTNYYQPLVNVDSILNSYKKDDNRDCIVLFLTDGYPNVDTPNEEAEYKYLKDKYPYITINGVQYEMGSTILEPIKKISDNQFIANMSTLNNILFDASVTPLTYDDFTITDYINTEYFDIDKVTPDIGKAKIDNNKVAWTIDKLKSGSNAKLTIDISLKDKYKDKEGLAPTNTKAEVTSTIDDIKEDVKSSETPIIALSYKVIYDGNAPEGCNVEGVPASENKAVYDTVGISNKKLTCEGYKFKGWELATKDIKKVNDDYFLMPESDVTIRAVWSKVTIAKKTDGTIKSVISTLQKVGDFDYNEKLWGYKSNITKIVLQNKIQEIDNATYSFDISAEEDESVMAYLVPNEDDSTKYTAYIQGNGKIYANEDSSNLFSRFSSLTEIENLNILNTSKVTTMQDMFNSCTSLKKLDLSSFDTSKVTTMHGMFSSCTNLTELVLDNLNTSKVTNMQAMFNSCTSLKKLDLSSFDTSKVTTMQNMFSNCKNILELDVSNFNTSKVKNMWNMFLGCSKLTTLDLSSFDTSSVTTMYSMFSGCNSLTELNLSNFNTINVTSMLKMFYNCNNLTALNLSNFNTSKITNMSYMFNGCSSLENLDLSHFNTSNVKEMQSMFNGCSSLTSLDLSNFNTSKITNMSYMFNGCSSLTSLDVSNFDTSNTTNMLWMFRNCKNLTNLNLSNFDTSTTTSMKEMFNGCSSLVSLDFRKATFSSVVIYTDIFKNTSNNIEVIVKDDTAKSWTEARLGSGKGTVTIAGS